MPRFILESDFVDTFQRRNTMADTPGKRPNDPNQTQDVQDTEDSFYDVLLWILRIAFILMLILILINLTILSKSHVSL